jgi:hypothetical protein
VFSRLSVSSWISLGPGTPNPFEPVVFPDFLATFTPLNPPPFFRAWDQQFENVSYFGGEIHVTSAAIFLTFVGQISSIRG